MATRDPFRAEDLHARIEALRAERDELRRQLAVVRHETRRWGVWSWRRFLLGLALLPVSIVMSGLLVRLFN